MIITNERHSLKFLHTTFQFLARVNITRIFRISISVTEEKKKRYIIQSYYRTMVVFIFYLIVIKIPLNWIRHRRTHDETLCLHIYIHIREYVHICIIERFYLETIELLSRKLRESRKFRTFS